MSLVEHAKREFKRKGYIPLDEEQEDGPNKWIQENVLELLEVFSKQGHSGMSASFCLNYFDKLANFKLISPIEKEEDFDFGEPFDKDSTTRQSKVISSVFKDETGVHYNDGIVFCNQEGNTFTTGTWLPERSSPR
jgi:hypothetical protein